MLRFDSITISIPYDVDSSDSKCFQYINTDKMNCLHTTYPATAKKPGGTCMSYQHKSDVSGFNGFTYYPQKKSVTMSISSKILGKDYINLINKTNISKVVDILNGTHAIFKLNFDQFYEQSIVTHVDVTQNILTTHSVDKYINELSTLTKYTTKYFKEEYDSSGLVFKAKNKRNTDRMVIYDKKMELEHQQQDFIKRAKIDLEQFNNILRFEMNISSSNLDTYFGTNNLKNIIESDCNPLYQLFLNITKNYDGWFHQVPKIDDIMNQPGTPNKIFNELGRFLAFEYLKSDINTIRGRFKSRNTKNKIETRYANLIQKTLAKMDKIDSNNILSEIRASLCGVHDHQFQRRFYNSSAYSDDEVDDKTIESDSSVCYEYNKCVLSDDDDGIPIMDEDIVREYEEQIA